MVVYIFVMFCCFFIKEIYNFTHSVNCCYIFFGERCMVEIKKENRKVKSHFITGLLLVLPTVLFFVYVVICYVSIYGVYYVRRHWDTEELNKELEDYKKAKKSAGGGEE